MWNKTHTSHSSCDPEPTTINGKVYRDLTKQPHLLHQAAKHLVSDELWYLIASPLHS